MPNNDNILTSKPSDYNTVLFTKLGSEILNNQP